MIEWHKTSFDESELETLPACDLCGAPRSQSRALFQKSGLTVNHCPRCGVLYVNPRLRTDILWQRYSDEYFQNEYLPIHGQYHAAHNDGIHAPNLRELGRFAKPGKLFEFGAAIGLFLVAAKRAGWEVAGNELSSFAAAYAQQQFQIPVTSGRAEDVDLPAGSYDAVALWETIEHVQSPHAVLRKAAELLRPGGSWPYPPPISPALPSAF